jgi:hexosaminidase
MSLSKVLLVPAALAAASAGAGSGPPTCEMACTPSSPTAGEVVTLSANASDPDGGPVLSCCWDFGDGAIDGGNAPRHRFTVGQHTVCCTLIDDEGATSTCASTIVVARGHR